MRLLLIRIGRKLLYDTKLRHKILFTYMFLILLPLVCFQWIASDKISSVLEQYVLYSANQGFDQTISFLSYKFAKIAETSSVIVENPTVTEVLETHQGENIDMQISDYQWLKQFLRSLQNEDIARAALFVPDSFIFSGDGENFYPFEPDYINGCIRKMVWEKDTYLWCSPQELDNGVGTRADNLYLIRNIHNSNNYRKISGRVELEVKDRTIRAILDGADVVKSSVTYLEDPGRHIILASNRLDDRNFYRDFTASASTEQSASVRTGKYYDLYRALPNSQWVMVTAIPLDGLMSESRKLKNELILLLLLIAAVAYLCAYWLAHTVTRRISYLDRNLRNAESGEMRALRQMGGKDEVGNLILTYNFMINRIEQMKQEHFRMGQEVKNAELKALQSQINPHFLYNTLDLINWMANKGMNREIKRIIKTLSRYYKLTLNNGRDLVPLRDELAHVALYMEIQNTRFENRIRYLVDISDEVALDSGIPKITLQPLVENAIFHGIQGRADRTGTIQVTVRRQDGDILLTVADDGIGMSGERLQHLMKGGHAADDSGSGSGYGSRNVAQRLSQYFGDRYGIHYRSTPGSGTSVEILMPFCEPAE